MRYRAGYNYDWKKASDEARVYCDPAEDRCKQSFAEDADINTIVRRFGVTGKVPTTLKMPISGDFTEVSDFHSAMNLIREAEVEFRKVPAELRERLQHDPGKFMKWIEDPKNVEEGERFGLWKRKDVPRAPEESPPAKPAANL